MARWGRAAGLAIAVLADLSLAARAQPPPSTRRLFECKLGDKSVSITATGGGLAYDFGTPGHPDLSIREDRALGNVRYFDGMYAGRERQLRFLNGEYSYIVFSMEGKPSAGARPVSGLIVLQGRKTLSDRPCRPFAAFDQRYDYGALPTDPDQFSAMQVE